MGWLAQKIFNPIFDRLGLTTENALKFKEWSRGKVWVQIPLWIFILWSLGFANPYWCVYPVCWIS